VNESIFEWLQNSALAVNISENWFPFVESMHVVFLAVVIGTIYIVDTRLLGITSRQLRFTYLSDRLLPWTWSAFIGAAITGSLMFIAGATGYIDNKPFLIKMALLLLAGLNMLYFQFVTFRGVQSWDAGRPPPAAKFAGAFSIVLWTAIVGFGRWIGFV
jgi:hypothetical protein